MPQFEVDEELAALVEKLAKPRPFEHLNFNDALWRVVGRKRSVTGESQPVATNGASQAPGAEEAKKTQSPNCRSWVDSVAELKGKRGLDNWQAVCTYLKIATGGDSARRVLKSWVSQHKPAWTAVPALPGD